MVVGACDAEGSSRRWRRKPVEKETTGRARTSSQTPEARLSVTCSDLVRATELLTQEPASGDISYLLISVCLGLRHYLS